MVYMPTPGPPKVAYHRYLTDSQGMPLGVIRMLNERCRICAIRGQLGVIYDDPQGRYEQVQCLTCDFALTRPKRDDPGRRMNQGAAHVVAQLEAQERAQAQAMAAAQAAGAVIAPGFLPPQLPPVPAGYPMPGPGYPPQPPGYPPPQAQPYYAPPPPPVYTPPPMPLPQPTAGWPGQPGQQQPVAPQPGGPGWPPPGWPPNVG